MSHAIRRLLKYSVVGFSTFFLDLSLLYILTEVFSVHYILASGIAFFIAVSVNYALSRKYVFKNTLRGVREGYINFLIISIIGVCLVMGGMYMLVTVCSFNYLISRCFIAIVTGFWNYVMNLFVNFKVVGKY